ncbi:MAG: hypothetical protein ACR2GY_11920 [Phycisphaerales bacterium]
MTDLTRYFVLSGLPRSGTTYLAALVHQPPSVISISEAGGTWKNLYRSHGIHTPMASIAAIFKEYQQRLYDGDEIASFDSTAGYAGDARVDTWNQPKAAVQFDIAETTRLGFKNPEVFLAWLPTFLDAGFRCAVTVRHPLAVIASWQRKGNERNARGQSIHGTFADGASVCYVSSADTPLARCIDLYNALAQMILTQTEHPLLKIVRYEDWFSRGLEQLQQVCAHLEIPVPTALSPSPIAPPPLELSEDAIACICSDCIIAERFGYHVINVAEPTRLSTDLFSHG